MSAEVKLVRADQDTLRLEGRVDFSTAGFLYEAVKRERHSGFRCIDCRGIRNGDSATLSLLLACLRMTGDRKLHIDGLNEQLLGLARLYGVEELLMK